MSNQEINDWNPETKAVLERFLAAGWTIEWTDNGEEGRKPFTTLEEAIADVTACDEGWVRVTKDGNSSTLYLVFGNEPGVLISDYTYPAEEGSYDAKKGTEAWKKELDGITEAHYQEWDGRPQPKTTYLAKYGKPRLY